MYDSEASWTDYHISVSYFEVFQPTVEHNPLETMTPLTLPSFVVVVVAVAVAVVLVFT